MQKDDGHTKLTLTIVIPAYNEYPGIKAVLEELKAVSLQMEKDEIYQNVSIIVVSDGSTDQTASAVKEANINLIEFENNKGYGAALKAGFAAANSTHLTFLDADGTYPPSELPKLTLSFIKSDADIVIGNRLSGAPTGMPRVRFLGNKIFAWLTSWVSGNHVTDCASGMRVFNKKVLVALYPLPDGLDFTPAMTTRGLLEGLKFLEVPISYHERSGDSKLSAVKDGFRFFGSILRMTTYYNPLKFFGLIGVIMLVLGLGYSIKPIHHYIAFHEIPEWYIYRLVAILAFWLSGLQIIMLGILANLGLGIIHNTTKEGKIISFFKRKTLWNRLDFIGILMIVIATSLNWKNIIEYFSHGTISSHWSYLVVGALFFLTGIQLITVNILIRILAELKQRKEFIAEDLGNSN